MTTIKHGILHTHDAFEHTNMLRNLECICERPPAHVHDYPPVCKPLRPLDLADTFTSSLVPAIGYIFMAMGFETF